MDLCKNYNITPPKSCRKGSTWKTARNILGVTLVGERDE